MYADDSMYDDGAFWSVRLIVGLVALACGIWVAIDSSRLGAKKGRLGGGLLDQGPVAWALCVMIFFLIGFPCYLRTRPRLVAAHQRELAARGFPQAYPPPYPPPYVQAYPPPYQHPGSLQHYPPPQAPPTQGPFQPPA